METSFTINQDLTIKESMSSTLFYILSAKRFRLFIFFIVALATFTEISSLKENDLKGVLWNFLSILITIVILLIFITVLNLIFHKTKPTLFKFSYQFTDWGMFWKKDNIEFSKSWKEVDTFKESKAFFLLYTDKYNVHVIQKRLFKNQYDVFAFRDLLKEKLNK